jgi:CTP synthase
MQLGIIPDILLARVQRPLEDDMKAKIALFCNVSERNVISAEDITGSIYEIPYMFRRNEFDIITLEHFNIPVHEIKLEKWDKFIQVLRNPVNKVRIAVVGKYIQLQDAYRSIYEALLHGAVANEAELEIVRIDSEELETCGSQPFKEIFSNIDGILVPGGFGNRGIEGKILTIEYARTTGIPFFGICLGMQCAVIEFARNACGMGQANSTEFDHNTPYPVISLLEEQEIIIEKGGTMRLGAYHCEFTPGSKISDIYGKESVMERHRHRFEFTSKYRQVFEDHGMKIGGIYPRNNLVETVEIPGHNWFIGVQYHPEFKSKPINPHPLFRDFIRASIETGRKQ